MGGQTVTITGSGFVNPTINCGSQVWDISSFDYSSIVTTSKQSDSDSCELGFTQFGKAGESKIRYNFNSKSTSIVETISPKTGGTGGGTLLTISGRKLEKIDTIAIDGSPCLIQEKTDREIICETEPHEGSTFTGVPEFQTEFGLAECSQQFSYRKV